MGCRYEQMPAKQRLRPVWTTTHHFHSGSAKGAETIEAGLPTSIIRPLFDTCWVKNRARGVTDTRVGLETMPATSPKHSHRD